MATTTAPPPRAAGERSNRLLLILAIVAAGVAGVLVFVALRSSGSDSAAQSSDLEVVVASHDLAADTRLTGDDLEMKSVSDSEAIRDVYNDKSAAIGKTLRYPVLKGEQISTTKVGEAIKKADERTLSITIPTGLRAISVKTTEVALVGGNLLPGDMVDVIAVFDEQDLGDRLGSLGGAKAWTVLQNVTVLAVAQEPVEPLPASETPAAGATATTSRRPEDAQANAKARSVTLAVTPEQAQMLALVDKNATIYLSLRPPGETATPAMPASDLLPFVPLPATPIR